jgi:hypothetical protein
MTSPIPNLLVFQNSKLTEPLTEHNSPQTPKWPSGEGGLLNMEVQTLRKKKDTQGFVQG